MSVSIPAKPTTYGGIKYDSKLEAQWAVFFSHLLEESNNTIAVKYHPFTIEDYTPDFLVSTKTKHLIVEVKPKKPKPMYMGWMSPVLLELEEKEWKGYSFIFACGSFFKDKVPFFLSYDNERFAFTKFLPGKLNLPKSLIKVCLRKTKYHRFDI